MAGIYPKEHSKQEAFIAMDFKHKLELMCVRNTIKEAINETGYKPVIVDEICHTDNIPFRIDRQIKDARFVVADLTKQNCGVYYEAGLATGKISQ